MPPRLLRGLVGLALVLLFAGAARAEEEVVGTITYTTADGAYVDVGVNRGLRTGDVGVVRREGREVGRAEIVAASSDSARLRLLAGAEMLAGDRVHFEVVRREPEAGPEPEPKKPERTEEFVPLLERQQKVSGKAKERANLFHGRASLRQLFHADNEMNLDYTTTILGLNGSLDRIAGSPWALRWAGNLSRRSGAAFEGSELEGARLDLFEFAFARRLENQGFLRLGRFFPRELPGAGYLDGVQLETPRGGAWRLGALAGLKPTRDDLAPTADEPTAAVYATLERGGYSGTVGFLGSMFDGDTDRGALLVDQSFRPGPMLSVSSSAEIDLDVGGMQFREGTRLTRADLRVRLQPAPPFHLRAGFDHWEQLDTAAERAALDLTDPALFDSGFWRYWVGGGVDLPARLHVDTEVSVIHPESDNSDPHWRVTLSQHDFLDLPGSNVSLTAYNLEGIGSDGIGGLASGYFPFARGRWSVFASLAFRDVDDMGASFSVSDVSFRIEHRPSESRWSFHGAVSHSFGDTLDSTLLEAGLAYWW